jgi:hypothetical protein
MYAYPPYDTVERENLYEAVDGSPKRDPTGGLYEAVDGNQETNIDGWNAAVYAVGDARNSTWSKDQYDTHDGRRGTMFTKPGDRNTQFMEGEYDVPPEAGSRRGQDDNNNDLYDVPKEGVLYDNIRDGKPKNSDYDSFLETGDKSHYGFVSDASGSLHKNTNAAAPGAVPLYDMARPTDGGDDAAVPGSVALYDTARTTDPLYGSADGDDHGFTFTIPTDGGYEDTSTDGVAIYDMAAKSEDA